MGVTGPSTWLIEGKEVHVGATYVIVVNGKGQFTIDYMCEAECSKALDQASESAALAIAEPVMRYAVERKIYQNEAVRRVGFSPMKIELIGVALIQHMPEGRVRGYRVAKTVNELEPGTR